MFLVPTDTRAILDLTVEQLQYLPKIVLLREFGDYVERLWDKLPEHLRADTEVQSYRVCLKHYNRSWQRTHIDGPPPLIRNCGECQSARQASVRESSIVR